MLTIPLRRSKSGVLRCTSSVSGPVVRYGVARSQAAGFPCPSISFISGSGKLLLQIFGPFSTISEVATSRTTGQSIQISIHSVLGSSSCRTMGCDGIDEL